MATYMELLRFLDDVVGPALNEVADEIEQKDSNPYTTRVGQRHPPDHPTRPTRAAKSISLYGNRREVRTVSFFIPDKLEAILCRDIKVMAKPVELDIEALDMDGIKELIYNQINLQL